MTHQQNRMLVGIAICLLSPLAFAAAAADAKAPAAAVPPPEAKAATAEAAPASPAPPLAKKSARGGGDARKCLKQPDNKGVRRCAEKYR